MKSCLSDLYRKVSAQIRRELKLKDDENKLRLYKHYIPFIVNAITESIKVDSKKLALAFQNLAERYVSGELTSITRQIYPDSNQKRNEVNNKKKTINNTNDDANKLNKFDTRTSILKHGNKIKQSKTSVSRKITRK
jgi:hypothetical protein